MDLGKNIKELRTKKGLSQKQLADQLFVTYQAVSRWENNQAEPSIDTLRSMAKIFGCSIEDIISSKDTTNNNSGVVPTNVPNENRNTATTKQVIAFCDKCDKPIYELSNLKRFSPVIKENGLTKKSDKKINYCVNCYNKYIQEQRDNKIKEEEQKYSNLKHSRKLSFGLSIALSLIVLLIGVLVYTLTDNDMVGIFFMVSSVPTFTFVGTMVLDNTFLNEFWFGALELGFVKMPGIIFTFDIGGFIFLIVMKILFAVIGFLIGVAVFLFATGISYFLSLFAYPLALYRNSNDMPELNSAQNLQSIKGYVESKEKTSSEKKEDSQNK